MCSIFCITEKDIDCPRVRESFYKTVSRGPDMSEIKELPTGYMGFHRLAIMGLTAEGMQPFARGKDFLICNGERGSPPKGCSPLRGERTSLSATAKFTASAP